MRIELPTSGVAYIPGASVEEVEAHKALMNARFRFAMQYAVSQGWSQISSELTMRQILEIRNQPGWETPEHITPVKEGPWRR